MYTRKQERGWQKLGDALTNASENRETPSPSFGHVSNSFIPIRSSIHHIYRSLIVGHDILKSGIETVSSFRKVVSAFTNPTRNTLHAETPRSFNFSYPAKVKSPSQALRLAGK